MSPLSFITDLFSPVLADRQIKKLYSRGQLIRGQLSEHQFQPNSVDLTLGNSFTVLLPNCAIPYEKDDIRSFNIGGHPTMRDGIDPKLEQIHSTDTFRSGRFVLEPGAFVLMATREQLMIPNGIMGFVCGRSSVARLAVQTEQAGLIDAGFQGTITLEVTNQSAYPIVLSEGMRIAQVWFIRAKRAEAAYSLVRSSKYGGQFLATGSRIHLDIENR